jgi:hypothetical protein
MNKPLLITAAIAALAVPAAVAGAADYGPNTCLNGYVWRAAFPGDATCVTPATRSGAAQDNAAAGSRRDPAAGYGPYGCQQGYVWREARASDLVCVTPNIRAQAKADNAAAPARRNAMNLTVTRSGGKHVVTVTGINNGTASVGMYFNNGKGIAGWKVNVSGNRFSFNTGKSGCSGGPQNAFFQVKDNSSGRWSQRVYVNYCVAID